MRHGVLLLAGAAMGQSCDDAATCGACLAADGCGWCVMQISFGKKCHPAAQIPVQCPLGCVGKAPCMNHKCPGAPPGPAPAPPAPAPPAPGAQFLCIAVQGCVSVAAGGVAKAACDADCAAYACVDGACAPAVIPPAGGRLPKAQCEAKCGKPPPAPTPPAPTPPAPTPPAPPAPAPPASVDVGYELLFEDALEEVADTALEINGTVPAWLSGSFIQTGPARWTWGARSFTHALDGYAKVHKWRFDAGAVRFSTRFLPTGFLNQSRELGDIAFGVFAQPTSPPQKWPGVKGFQAAPNDNNNVNTFLLGGDIELLSDQTTLVDIDPATLAFRAEHLATQIPNQTNPSLQVATMGSAHPFRTGDGDYLSVRETTRVVGVGKVASEKFSVYRVKAGSENRTIEDLCEFDPEGGKSSYTHSFGLAADTAVIAAQPLHVDATAMLLKGTLQAAMKTTKKNTKFYIVPLDGGCSKPVEIDAGSQWYFGHFVNTFQPRPGVFVADIDTQLDIFFDRYDLATQRDKAARDAWPRNHGYETVVRYEIDVAKKSVTSRPLFGVPPAQNIANEHDLFRLHPDDYGHEYCGYWAWQAFFQSASFASWAVVRVELCGDAPRVAAAWYRPNWYPGEAAFVPRPGAMSKTDGVLIFKVLDGNTGRSLVVVADAMSLDTLAESVLPAHVPFTVHGNWFDGLH